MEKPRQNWAGLFNISFGFFGIQIGFALQNANMSRVFQSLGSSIDDLPALWVAAPLTGLLVQPIIGHLSDKTWLGRLGRRRPYFLLGAVLAAFSLLAMPESNALLMAAVLLWVLDASLNISMEPFRAFVGDMLRKDQHTAGYVVQTAFIGAGAVVGSIFPYLLDHWGVANEAVSGGIPDTVRYSFWAGGIALFLSVLWTVFTTKEYSPTEMRAFDGMPPSNEDTMRALAAQNIAPALVWFVVGSIILGLAPPLNLPRILYPIDAAQQAAAWILTSFGVPKLPLEKEISLLGLLAGTYGLLSLAAIKLARRGRGNNALASIVGDFAGMPPIMKRLALVQFFSWSALFIMWINTTPVVTQNFFGSADPASAAYQQGGNWVGVLFATYNGVAAIAALTVLPLLSRRFGKARTHMVCLLAGALGYASFFVLKDPQHLILSEIGIGIAWASILAMPYAILASSLPQAKLGIYMGLFNVFVVVPQLLVATVMGSIMQAWFPGQPIWTMAFAAGTLVLAALAMLRVQVPGEDQAVPST